MGLFSTLFGDKGRTLLLDLIERNADLIERDERRVRIDAEYLAICLILDDLATKPKGHEGHVKMMDILAKEHPRHQSNVMTYLAVKQLNLKLKPAAEVAVATRHRRAQHKDPCVEALALNDQEFTRFVTRAVGVGPLEAWTMYAIAMPNVTVFMSVSAALAREKGAVDIPVDIDGFIRFLSATIAERTSEVEKSRLTWQMMACLIVRATECAKRNEALADDLAQIWLMLIQGGIGLHDAVRYNQSWSAGEKEFFREVKSRKSGMEHILRVDTPRFIRRHPAVVQFAEDNDLGFSW